MNRKQRKPVKSLNDVFSPDYCHKTDSCWLWVGKVNHHGYGVFMLNRKWVGVHRFVLELTTGPLGDLEACHVCDVKHCINPSHLFRGSHKENMLDMWEKGRARPAGKYARLKK